MTLPLCWATALAFILVAILNSCGGGGESAAVCGGSCVGLLSELPKIVIWDQA